MLFHQICGIDLGNDTIKISDKKRKRVVCEKNMIAIREGKYLIAIGNKAYEMYEKTPLSVAASSPMVNGAIADGTNLETLLTRMLRRFSGVFSKYPDILITAPMDLSEVEVRAFYKILSGGLKAKRVALVEKGIADAVGADLPVLSKKGSMIVNIGAATTEISVISEGKIIIGRQLRTGGFAMDSLIETMVRRQYSLNIGKKTSSFLKEQMTCLGEEVPFQQMKVYGIHTVSGLPTSATITAEDVSSSIQPVMDDIINDILLSLERTPPQMLENIKKTGVYMTGGVCRMGNFLPYMEKKLGTAVHLTADPLYNSMNGLIEIINDRELRKLTYSLKEYVGNLV